jgi:hypothetical protein
MNPNEQLNEKEPESLLGETDPDIEFELKSFVTGHSVTGGKGPGLVRENEPE